MSNLKILTTLYLLLTPALLWAESPQISEELNYPDLSAIYALPEDSSVRPEFKAIQNQIKNSTAKPFSCPKKLQDDIKKHSSNRGLQDSVYFYLGICKDLEGDSKEAAEAYLQSLKLKRSNKEAILRLAYIHALLKEYDKSLQLSEEVLWLGYKPKDVPLYLTAFSQKQLGNIKEAKANLDKLDAINSKFPPSLVLRKNLILEEIKQTPDPTKVKVLRENYNRFLPRLIALDPENRTYNLEYAKILLSQGDPIHSPNILNQGLSITKKFSKVEDKIDEAFLLLQLQFLERQGKATEALDMLNKLSQSKPLGPNIEFRKQEIFNKLNPQTDT